MNNLKALKRSWDSSKIGVYLLAFLAICNFRIFFFETYEKRLKNSDEKRLKNFLYRGTPGTIKQLTNQDTFIVTRFENLINYDLIYENFDKLTYTSLEEFIECCNHVHIVKFNRLKWSTSICTCRHYLKEYFCYHIFVVAINQKLISVPLEFKNCKIGQKPKLGRKPKAKAGDALKKN